MIQEGAVPFDLTPFSLNQTKLRGLYSKTIYVGKSGKLGCFVTNKLFLLIIIMSQVPYLQHFIFFVTYEWAQ
jgi:hypothetical protein